jgi:hypothetical protein
MSLACCAAVPGDCFQVAFELFQDLLLAKVVDGIAAGRLSKARAEGSVGDESYGRGLQCRTVFRRDYQAAARVGEQTVAADNVCDLGTRIGGRNDGTAARQHAAELRRHDQISGSGTLQEKVDISRVE